MKSIILIGGGGHCKSCIDVIESVGKYNIVGILDSIKQSGDRVLGYPVLGYIEILDKLIEQDYSFLITVGQIYDVEPRIELYKLLVSRGAKMPVIISPLARVSKHAIIGQGTIVMHFALVNAAASVGVNCILNSKSLVEHDVSIGDHCHISTGSLINGGVQIGSGSFVGSGATFKQGARIGNNSFIKANSLVI
jgi:sugar O-acyltransferase (sialic acid O-acetyltransferase NeuD family)